MKHFSGRTGAAAAPAKTKPSIKIDTRNPILLLGDLRREAKIFADIVKTLPEARDGLHGQLQVLLSSIRRSERIITDLIDGEEAE